MSSYTLSNCEIIDNSAALHGGAIWCNASMTLMSCEIIGNSALGNGGAILSYLSNGPRLLTLANCTIISNSAHGFGAPLAVHLGCLLISGVLVYTLKE